jgi:hypothetical protein
MPRGRTIRLVLLLIAVGVAGYFAFFYVVLPSLMMPVSLSYVNANEPAAAEFDGLLKRDLQAYFDAKSPGAKLISVELLRKGATQVGVSYPKYYAWVETRSADDIRLSGAVRVAAIDRVSFEITDFITCADLAANSGLALSTFPRSVYERALKKISETRCAGAR